MKGMKIVKNPALQVCVELKLERGPVATDDDEVKRK